MNSDLSEDNFKELCRSGELQYILEQYISDCLSKDTSANGIAPNERNSEQAKAKKQESKKASFPNVAGFCRYLGISTDELEKLSRDFPLQYGRLLSVFEDEALNSGLSPTLLSAYLKKRIGYEGAKKSTCDGQIRISFEHDILEDGE